MINLEGFSLGIFFSYMNGANEKEKTEQKYWKEEEKIITIKAENIILKGCPKKYEAAKIFEML